MSESGDSDVTDEFRLFTGVISGGHPITRYPQRILSNIFICWRDQWIKNLFSGIKGGSLHHGVPAPFILAAVSRQFRDAAMATPALWSFIYVDFAAENRHIVNRLRHMLWLAQETPLSICFKGVTIDAFSTTWFQQMHAMLDPTRERWGKVVASFPRPDDLAQCWESWPLTGSNLADIRLWCAIEGPSAQPASFLAGCQALQRVELRNVVWVHHKNKLFPTVTSLSIGPSDDQVLGPTSIIHLCHSFPFLSQLRVLTFEKSALVPLNIPLPSHFRLQYLTHLTVSPILLRTSLQGYEDRRVLPALMRVSVHFCPSEDDEMDVDEEHFESARRNEDLETVGKFLQKHAVETLKLQGLDKGYSPSALCTSLFRTMNTSRLFHLVLHECRDHTTQYIGVATTRVSLAQETSRAALRGRVPRILQLGVREEGSIYLLPSLKSLRVIKCSDIEGEEVLAYVRAAPRGLREVLIRESDIDEGSYEEIKSIFV